MNRVYALATRTSQTRSQRSGQTTVGDSEAQVRTKNHTTQVKATKDADSSSEAKGHGVQGLRSRNSDLPDEVSGSKYFDWSALETRFRVWDIKG